MKETAPLDAQSKPPSQTAIRTRTGCACGAAASLVALIVLTLLWESWLAPLHTNGSMLVLKTLPLVIALAGIARRRLYTLQWASMLILAYLAEGVVRGMTDSGLSARLGWSEAGLAAVFFICALAYVAPFKQAARRRSV